MKESIFKKYTTPETWEKIVDFDSVTQMWKHCVAAYRSDEAVVDGEAYSFARLDGEAAGMRAYLASVGVKKGDRVGVLMPNSVSFVVAFLAITTLGAVAVLLPPHLDEAATFGCSMKFGLKALVYARAFESKLALLAARNPSVVCVAEDARSVAECPMAEVDGADPCTVIFTGGTTGKNKGALLSNRALLRGVKNGCFGIHDIFGERYLLVLPLTHVFGLIRNLLTSLYTGSSIAICRNNKDMFRDVAMHKPTIMVLVPALAEMALNLSKQFGRNLWGDSLKTIICGAATVNPYLVSEYDKLGVTLLPGYGLTESANLVSGNPESRKNPEAVGYIYDGIDYRIVDGELWLKGVNMMDCYVGEPEENVTAYEDGWFKTGDLVRMDEDGMLYIVGRIKEVIVLPTGENVSPAEVEARFNELTVVQDSLVSLAEDGTLALEVYPRNVVLSKIDTPDPEAYLREKIAEVNASLPSFMRVSSVTVRTTDFARSPSMKILRKKV